MTRIEVPNQITRRRSSSRLLWLVLVVLIAAAGVSAWTWITLSWSYSTGERAGVLQKFSRRGWLCKTDEGELAMYNGIGIAPQIWPFSVRDPQIRDEISKAVGRRVQLHYTEHPGVPSSCFGDTRYFVDRVVIVDAATPTPAAP